MKKAVIAVIVIVLLVVTGKVIYDNYIFGTGSVNPSHVGKYYFIGTDIEGTFLPTMGTGETRILELKMDGTGSIYKSIIGFEEEVNQTFLWEENKIKMGNTIIRYKIIGNDLTYEITIHDGSTSDGKKGTNVYRKMAETNE